MRELAGHWNPPPTPGHALRSVPDIFTEAENPEILFEPSTEAE